jgi:hypothetical protein
MHPPREPRLILIGTSLVLIVLLAFVLSFAAVFVIARRAPIVETAPLSAAAASSQLSPAPTAAPESPGSVATAPEPALITLLGAGSLLAVGGAVVWRLQRTRRGTAQPVEPALAAAPVAPVDGASLRVLRRGQHVVYSTLAQRTGLSTRYLAEIEYGLRTLDRGDLERIRRALAQEEEVQRIDA